MKKSLKYRKVIADVRRVVIKIGSRVLVQKTGRPDARIIKRLAGQISAIQRSGCETVIITSGAIGAGMEALGMKEKPESLPDLQMAAAVGQTRLMAGYAGYFGKLGFKVGQILLTHSDFLHKIRLTNARRTIENLLRNRVIPIINENDVVADEEIKADLALGDNDYLASLVVKLVRADLLILLTTVDGLREFTPNGASRRIRYLESITPATFRLVRAKDSNISKGGMASKLKAAQSVIKTGCTAVIAIGRRPHVLTSVMRGDDVGTIIIAAGV